MRLPLADAVALIMTSTKALSVNGLVPPTDFPSADFEAVDAKLTPHSGHSAHKHFIGAWNAISYRYMAFAEYDQQFTASVVMHGPGPGHPIRFEQERDLFGFFSSGVSVFDAFCFGTFAIGALTGSTDFCLVSAKDEEVRWKSLLSAYTKSFATDPVVPMLKRIDTDRALVEIRAVRNVLTHRAAPPRQFALKVGPQAIPTARISRVNLTLDKNTTASRRKEIAQLLSLGLSGVRSFVDARL